METTEVNPGPAPAPMTALQEQMLQICREILQTDSIGPDDSFYDVGGDSMMMMVVLSRVKEEFGVELEHTEAFQSKTLRELSDMVRDGMARGGERPEVEQGVV